MSITKIDADVMNLGDDYAFTGSVTGVGGFTVGTKQATTSGTSFTFSGIKAGANVISVSLDRVSLSGTDSIKVQLGDSGGIETSGYKGNAHAFPGGNLNGIEHSDSFAIYATGSEIVGNLILRRTDTSSHTWVANGNFVVQGGPNFSVAAGYKTSLDSVVTQLKVLATGSNTFDAGSINIMYQ